MWYSLWYSWSSYCGAKGWEVISCYYTVRRAPSVVFNIWHRRCNGLVVISTETYLSGLRKKKGETTFLSPIVDLRGVTGSRPSGLGGHQFGGIHPANVKPAFPEAAWAFPAWLLSNIPFSKPNHSWQTMLLSIVHCAHFISHLEVYDIAFYTLIVLLKSTRLGLSVCHGGWSALSRPNKCVWNLPPQLFTVCVLHKHLKKSTPPASGYSKSLTTATTVAAPTS